MLGLALLQGVRERRAGGAGAVHRPVGRRGIRGRAQAQRAMRGLWWQGRHNHRAELEGDAARRGAVSGRANARRFLIRSPSRAASGRRGRFML
jgi:hypothetical protein